MDKLKILIVASLFLFLSPVTGHAHYAVNHPDPRHDFRTFHIFMPGFYFPASSPTGYDVAVTKVDSPCPLEGFPPSYGDVLVCGLYHTIPPTTYTVSAVDNGDGSVFVRWSADGSAYHCNNSTETSCAFAHEYDTAVYLIYGWPVTVSTAGSGSGTVRVAKCSGAAEYCPPIAPLILYEYPNHSVYLNITAAPGSVFTHWTGDCPGSCLWGAPRSATAHFSLLRTLTVSKTGSGIGTVTSIEYRGSPRINCGQLCSASIADGDIVTLKAVASAGSVFKGWSGACSGTGYCIVTVDANKSVTANFESLRCSGLTLDLFPVELWPDKTGVDGVPTNSLVTAKVSKPAPSGGCELKFEVEPTLSKGHDHGTHLKDKAGKLTPESCTIAEGTAMCSVIYYSPEISGEEKIVGKLMSGSQVKETKDATMRIRVTDLGPLSGGGSFELLSSTNHDLENHYGMSALTQKVISLALAYYSDTGRLFDANEKLRIGNMSLPWGGLFDIGPPEGTFWSSPHKGHRKGTSVDVSRYINTAGTIQTKQDTLDRIAREIGGLERRTETEASECPVIKPGESPCIHYELQGF